MSILKRLSAIFYPQRCIFCFQVVHYNEICCKPCCERLLQSREPFFPAECDNLSGCVAPFLYQDEVRERLLQYKSPRHRDLGHAFASLAAPMVKKALGDIRPLVCCVPNFEPQNQKVYNPARVFARSLAAELSLPLEGALLRQTRQKEKQHLLSAGERLLNVEALYEAAFPEMIRGRDLLLCDDIITTGATLNACAGALRLAGARRVFGAACARTILANGKKSG